MKIVGVIPARYQSSRLPGKPLADICGKPMIWWVYQQAKKVPELSDIYVATDDSRIQSVCHQYDIPVVMTSVDNPTHVHRTYDFAKKVPADLYVIVLGDEPLIESEVISKVIPETVEESAVVARSLMRNFTDPTELIDPANIKVAANAQGDCMYLSRSPVPFPYKTVLFKYRKTVGVDCYNMKALEFFVNTEPGFLETVEDIAILRFMENKVGMNFTLVESNALAVDTERDLQKVRKIIEERN